MKRVIENFTQIGSIKDAKHTERPNISRSNINIDGVGESPRNSLQRILAKDMCQYAFKVQVMEE